MDKTDLDSSQTNAGHLLVEAIEKYWRNYRTELKRCRKEFTNDAVHDLRVAARRLMAIVQLLQSMAPRPRLKKIIRALKEQLDEFDALRDTQVILAEISETIQKLPELQSFQKEQQRQEERHSRRLRKQIKKFSTRQLSKRIHKTHDSLQGEENDDLEAAILQAVDDAYRITEQRFASVDLASPVTIHRVRIAFKRFRYMVEIIHPLLKDFPETNLKYMHNYQTLMGDVQDAEVFLQTLNDFSEGASFSDPEAIQRYYERRRAEAIALYASEMNQLHRLWRPAPDQPFPWEKPE